MEALWAELGVKPLPEGERRVAQPPYDRLPCPRADLPEGILLSREATHYLHERDIPTVTFTDASGKPLLIKKGTGRNAKKEKVVGPAIALPLYEGRMIGQFDFSEKGWVSGKGRGSVWEQTDWQRKVLSPQFLMGTGCFPDYDFGTITKLGQMRVTSGTNTRTLITTALPNLPCGDKVATLRTKSIEHTLSLTSLLDSFVADFHARTRIAALQIDQHILFALAAPFPSMCSDAVVRVSSLLLVPNCAFANTWIRLTKSAERGYPFKRDWALTPGERIRLRAILEALSAQAYGIGSQDYHRILGSTDYSIEYLRSSKGSSRLPPKGFWRVDKEKHPEHRLTILSLVAFADLQETIDACGGNVERGIEAFCTQNDGEGWMLPETLRLADYGLGHDDRAKHPQPVRECFGSRFYDWQLAQSPEESWRECRLHARNLLGKQGYQALLDELAGKKPKKKRKQDQEDSFDDLPLFRQGK